MANWKTFRITHTSIGQKEIFFYLDGYIDYRDANNEPRIILENCSPFNSLEPGDYLEIQTDRLKGWPYQSTIPHIFARPTSSSSVSSSNYSTRDAMIRASSVNQTALAITREGMDRVDRNREREFEYKMEDNSGNKHHWIYRKS